MLGRSRHKVLSDLDLKGAFHSLRLSENSDLLLNFTYIESALYFDQRIPMGSNISPSIWQSYINVILNCLQSRKYCGAIMDDLLLFSSTMKLYMATLEDLLKALLKMDLKYLPKKC